MGFKSFNTLLWVRIVLVIFTTCVSVISSVVWNMWPVTLALVLVLVAQSFEFHYFLSKTNRKLTSFLDSVKYSDFETTFTVDNKLGKTFKNLNKSFNNVLDEFRSARIEKEEHLQYLNLVVEHVDTGLLSFEDTGKVDVINSIASRLLGIRKIRHMDELKDENHSLYDTIWNLEVGKKATFVLKENVHLAIRMTQFVRKGQFIKLAAIQNIYSELAEKELDSFQKLLSVLRHEIMNSMTPISSLTSTLKSIIAEDIIKENGSYTVTDEVLEDLNDSIDTIDSRSKGLVSFLQSYRDYTSLPKPHLEEVEVNGLISKTVQLMLKDRQKNNISISHQCKPKDLQIHADVHLIEQVLINLIKNACEAFNGSTKDPAILVSAYREKQYKIIQVDDNGQGIVPEAIEKIFIPFYTNKQGGSGIGLSLSQQIMNLHGGSLTVESEPGVRTTFRLLFN